MAVRVRPRVPGKLIADFLWQFNLDQESVFLLKQVPTKLLNCETKISLLIVLTLDQ